MNGRNILLIHGEKPGRDNALHLAFKERLELALELIERNNYDLILVTGGQTRNFFPPESQIGYEYLRYKTRLPVIQENRSHTTVENILFCREVLSEYQIGHIDIITSKVRLRRFKYLYKRLWPELSDKCRIFGAKDSYFFLYPLVEIVYILYSFFDLKEKVVPRLTKKIFRNAF
jgi:hypothetical protein